MESFIFIQMSDTKFNVTNNRIGTWNHFFIGLGMFLEPVGLQ
jgi:hypothetical protein